MKIVRHMWIGIALLAFWQCGREEDITAELVPYRRLQDYDVNSPDTVIRFVSRYYDTYGRVFITDPDSTDYLYNFEVKNPVFIAKPEQSEAHLLYGISCMKEFFLDFYPEKFIREHFPFSLMISDSIVVLGGMSPKTVDMYVSRNFVALNVGRKNRDYTFEEKKHLSLSLHIAFLVDILYRYGGWDLSAFFAPGEKLYATQTGDWDHQKKLKPEELYSAGFFYDQAWTNAYTEFVSKTQDLTDWLSFILGYKEDEYSKIPDNVEEWIARYPVMKQKYDALAEAIRKYVGVNYKDLIYKE